MSETKTPGLCAKHAIITPTCRQKGDEAVIDEALARLRAEYIATAPNWPLDGARFHVVLTVERIGSITAWLVERATADGPAWAKMRDSENDTITFDGWTKDSNEAFKFETECAALDAIPLLLEDGEDYPCPSVTATEHEWVDS
ncbi:MAG TPA: hypothetical protein VHO25_22010 [Polyangiaceae bacterium]|nr:hypothetical protein [Polyangiaceae bacterium]